LSLDFALFNTLAPLDAIHNSAIDAFVTYRDLRAELTERLGAEMTGMVGTSTVTLEQKVWMAPREAVLDNLIASMVVKTRSESKEAADALMQLYEKLRQEFSLKFKMERVPD